jgi:DNA polymerase-1
MRVVADIETDGLNNPSRVWCCVAIDIDTGKEYVFDFTKDGSADLFMAWAGSVSTWIGHNFIDYDHAWIERLLKYRIDPSRVVDTLVLSHLLKYRLDDGHSLEAWGTRLGIAKVGLDVDFTDQASLPIILKRCKTDVEINLKLYEYLMSKLDRHEFKEAIETEMEFAWVCREMHENGFAFDIEGAKELYNEIDKEVQELDLQIKAAFPPKAKLVREYTPRLTKHGTISRTSVPRDWTDLSDLTPGCTFSLIKFEEFNPTSTKQIIERISQYWDPVDRTDTYLKAQKARDKEKLKKLEETAWKVNETNLSTLSEEAPAGARFLVRRLMLGARLRTLTEWMQAYNTETGRVHGRFNGIGTWTHRMAHKEPNLGNVAAEKSIKYNTPELKKRATELGGRMRSLWTSATNAWLVGCDMESAHLRIFAHLINDEKFKEALLKGDKKLGTDPHSVNARLLGLPNADRDRSKTFIFTFLNGGGVGKVRSIFGTTLEKAKEALGKFIEGYPGLASFKKKDAKDWARRGYFVGPDGRFVVNDSDHHMLAGYLQNYEAVIVKKTVLLSLNKIRKLGIPCKPINVVHDEIIYETDTKEHAEQIGKIVQETFREVGELYKMRIPIDGECKIGKTWLEVH